MQTSDIFKSKLNLSFRKIKTKENGRPETGNKKERRKIRKNGKKTVKKRKEEREKGGRRVLIRRQWNPKRTSEVYNIPRSVIRLNERKSTERDEKLRSA